MAEVALINQLLNALSVGLNSIYPDIAISKEDVPNSLPDKVFLIGVAGEISTQKQPNNRFRVSGSFDITYLSEKNDLSLHEELNNIALTVPLNLSIIEYQGLRLRLSKFKSKTDDDELHITCDFNMFIRTSDDSISTMKNIEVRT